MKKGVSKNKEEGDTRGGSLSFAHPFVKDSKCSKDKENCTVNENSQGLPIKERVTFEIPNKKKSPKRKLVASTTTSPEDSNSESDASKIEKTRRRKLNIMFAIIIVSIFLSF